MRQQKCGYERRLSVLPGDRKDRGVRANRRIVDLKNELPLEGKQLHRLADVLALRIKDEAFYEG